MNKNIFSHTSLPEYDGHRLVLYINQPQFQLEGFIAIHRGSERLKSFGATRIYKYSDQSAALRDALRLSRMMSFKAAAVDLPYGGAKAVLIASEQQKTTKLFAKYCDYVNMLSGRFVTGADIGVGPQDVKKMRKFSENVVGVHIDPVMYTVLGVIQGIKSGLKFSFGSDSIAGRSFAIQGLGKIGSGVLSEIYKDATQIIVTDVSTQTLSSIKKKYPKVKIVKSELIASQNVDVFVPCAMHGSINQASIKELKCRVVAGGANNQLENPKMGEKLHKRNILYVPDYIINAGGLISVVDEFEHKRRSHSRVVQKISIISSKLDQVFTLSKRKNLPTSTIADEITRKSINSNEE